MSPPLAGLKVLDLSRVLAGPWCTMSLADLGAEVTKIEPPSGDDTRQWGPPFAAGESAYFLCANRSKRSVIADLTVARERRAVIELAHGADVIVENFKVGGLKRFGLDYASVHAENPAAIYCSISGYGQTSPRARMPGYDYVIQAEGGLMAVTGPTGGEPTKVGVAVVDLMAGMYATQAILAALIARQRDGVGQQIDIALYDAQLAMLANVGSAYLLSGEEPKRYGNGHPTVVPYETFAAADGTIVVAVGNDRQFAALCRTLGCALLSEDRRFAGNSDRVINRAALIPILSDIIARETRAHWLSLLQGASVPCAPVRSVGEALTAPETAARNMVTTVDHPRAGAIKLVASPIRLSRTPVIPPRAPPLLGEHTEEVIGIEEPPVSEPDAQFRPAD